MLLGSVGLWNAGSVLLMGTVGLQTLPHSLCFLALRWVSALPHTPICILTRGHKQQCVPSWTRSCKTKPKQVFFSLQINWPRYFVIVTWSWVVHQCISNVWWQRSSAILYFVLNACLCQSKMVVSTPSIQNWLCQGNLKNFKNLLRSWLLSIMCSPEFALLSWS